MKPKARGFSLIELIIGLVILAILLALAAPSFSAWIRDTKIRTSAESILNGLQLARGEAVRRNEQIRFQLTDSLGSDCVLKAADPDPGKSNTNWVVSGDDPTGKCDSVPINESLAFANNVSPRIIQSRSAGEGSNQIVADANVSTGVFNSLGRISGATPAAAAIKVKPVGVTDCVTPEARCLCVTVSLGGQVRLCDPKLPKKDPQSCFDRQDAGATATCTLP